MAVQLTAANMGINADSSKKSSEAAEGEFENKAVSKTEVHELMFATEPDQIISMNQKNILRRLLKQLTSAEHDRQAQYLRVASDQPLAPSVGAKPASDAVSLAELFISDDDVDLNALSDRLVESGLTLEDLEKLFDLLNRMEIRQILNDIGPDTVTALKKYTELSKRDQSHLRSYLSSAVSVLKKTDFQNGHVSSGIDSSPDEEEPPVATFTTRHTSEQEVYHRRNYNYLGHLGVRLLSELITIGVEMLTLVFVEKLVFEGAEVLVEPTGHCPAEYIKADSHLIGHIKHIALDQQARIIAVATAILLTYSPQIASYTIMPAVQLMVKGIKGCYRRAQSFRRRLYDRRIRSNLSTVYMKMNKKQRKSLLDLLESRGERVLRSRKHQKKKANVRNSVQRLLHETLSRDDAYALTEGIMELKRHDGDAFANGFKVYLEALGAGGDNKAKHKGHTLPLVSGWFTNIHNLYKRRHIRYSLSALAATFFNITGNIALMYYTIFSTYEQNAMGGNAIVSIPFNISRHGNETDIAGNLESLELPLSGRAQSAFFTVLYAVALPHLHKPTQALFILGSEKISGCLSWLKSLCWRARSPQPMAMDEMVEGSQHLLNLRQSQTTRPGNSPGNDPDNESNSSTESTDTLLRRASSFRKTH